MEEFSQLPELLEIEQSLDSGNKNTRIQASMASVPLLRSNISKKRKDKILVIVPEEAEARNLSEQLKFWSQNKDEVFHYPSNDALPYQGGDSDLEAIHQRVNALFRSQGERSQILVIGSVGAVLQKTISLEVLLGLENNIGINEEFKSGLSNLLIESLSLEELELIKESISEYLE